MKEIVVISGKGGAGKTSVAASLAALAGPAVLVDCDVDAADLHLVLRPDVIRRELFVGGSRAKVQAGHCIACGRCVELCRFGAISLNGRGNDRVARTSRVEQLACEGCGVCVDACALGAIKFESQVAGQWFVSDTRCGPMIHARLSPGAENSGKLVTRLRQTARQVALERNLELVLADGSPGIGCPVIASLTGTDLALIVSEPTISGLHDFERIARLTDQLAVPAMVVINKSDLNSRLADRLRSSATERGIEPIGDVPYDRAITQAQVEGLSVVEFSAGPASQAIRAIWQRLKDHLMPSVPGFSAALVQLNRVSRFVERL
jgi:MinD superfamily P-loop ATPase